MCCGRRGCVVGGVGVLSFRLRERVCLWRRPQPACGCILQPARGAATRHGTCGAPRVARGDLVWCRGVVHVQLDSKPTVNLRVPQRNSRLSFISLALPSRRSTRARRGPQTWCDIMCDMHEACACTTTARHYNSTPLGARRNQAPRHERGSARCSATSKVASPWSIASSVIYRLCSLTACISIIVVDSHGRPWRKRVTGDRPRARGVGVARVCAWRTPRAYSRAAACQMRRCRRRSP